MGGTFVKQLDVMLLSILLLFTAVPSEAFCLCNSNTTQCCSEKPAVTQGNGFSEPVLGENFSSLLKHGCSMDSIPCDSVSDATPCKHLSSLAAPVSATMPVVRNVDEPACSKWNSGAILPISAYDFAVLLDLVVSVSPKNPTPQVPAYLRFVSLLI